MKIDIILTGGTIGTRLNNNKTILDDTAIYQLLKEYNYEFTFHRPYNIHSENLRPKNWQKLYHTINTITNSDGIIVLHGTDTLIFTAAFLSLAFADTSIPIILASAHTPLGLPNSNAEDNLELALIALKNKVKGVFVSYRNDDCFPTLYYANKLIGFASPDNSNKLLSSTVPYAVYKYNKLEFSSQAFLEKPIPIKFPLNNIIVIPAIPFIDFSIFLNSSIQPDAYLVELYHSFTFPINNKHPQHCMLSFINTCRERKIKVFFTPYSDRDYYYPSKSYLPVSALIKDSTLPIAYTRLLFSKL